MLKGEFSHIKQMNKLSEKNLSCLAESKGSESLLIRKLASQKDTLSLNMRMKETSNVIKSYFYLNLVALERGNGRKVDGARVVVDYERGRTKTDWIPRRLGGGKGDKRRDRDTERQIRDLKKTHPLLRSRSRSKDKVTTNNGNDSNKNNETPGQIPILKEEQSHKLQP